MRTLTREQWLARSGAAGHRYLPPFYLITQLTLRVSGLFSAPRCLGLDLTPGNLEFQSIPNFNTRLNKSKRRVRRSRKTPIRSKLSLDPFVIATINPFHIDAAGARLPDDSMFPSIPYNATTRYTVTTNASGALAFAVTPSLKQSVYSCATANVAATGVISTWAGGTSIPITNYAAAQGVFELVRHVAWGVRILSTSSLTNTAGTLYACYVPNYYKNSIVPVEWPVTPDQMVALPWSTAVPVVELNTRSITLPAKRIDPSSNRYRSLDYPISAPQQIEQSDGWGSFVFILAGANAATTSLTVEIVYRTEMIPQPTATVISTGTAYPANTAVMDAVSNVSSVMPFSYAETDDPSFMQMVLNEAQNRLSTAWGMAAPSIARGLVAGASRVVTAGVSNYISSVNRPNSRRIGY